MFDWLLGKTCNCCDVKLPKNFKVIGNGFCSQKCDDLTFEVIEIYHNNERDITNLNGFDKRRIDTIRDDIEINRKKMAITFGLIEDV